MSLTTLFNGKVPDVKRLEPRTDHNSSNVEGNKRTSEALLTEVVRRFENTRFFSSMRRSSHPILDNTVYLIRSGRVSSARQIFIESGADLKDEKQAAVMAVADLIESGEYHKIPPIIKAYDLGLEQLKEAFGYVLIKDDRLTAVSKDINAKISALLEEAKKVLTAEELVQFTGPEEK
jgi:hypothetical protein